MLLKKLNIKNYKNKLTLAYALVILFVILIILFTFKALNKKSTNILKLSPAPINTNYLYQSINQDYKVYLGSRTAKQTPEVKMAVGSSSIDFKPEGSLSGQAKMTKQDQKSVVYKNIYPGVDLKYSLTDKGIKEEIILNNQPSTINHQSFSFALNLSNAIPKKDPMGNFTTTFVDPISGDYLFHFEKPFMVDAGGNRSEQVELKIQPSFETNSALDSASFRVVLVPDQNWLASAIYPVTIDPTVVHDEQSDFSSGSFNRVKNVGPVSGFSKTWTSTSDFNGVGSTASSGMLSPTTNDELKLGAGSGYGLDKCTGGTATANSYAGNDTPAKAFDDSESTIWQTDPTAYPHWIKYDFSAGVSWKIVKVRVKQYTVNFTGKNYTIAGSNNDSDWTTLNTGTMPNDTAWHDYTFSNSIAYRYIRITWSNAWNSSEWYQRVAEIEMMEADYASGEQTWTSETQDAGSGNTYQPKSLTMSWTLDGSDNIAPKIQVLGSSTGTFGGEETIYPAGAGTYYQNGGTYDIDNGVAKDITSQVTSTFRYWKVRAYLNTGSTTTDTPKIYDIKLNESLFSIELYEQELPADLYTVALWHMNETANGTCSGGQDACDSSGNGNHGTRNGTTITTTTQKLGDAARSFNGSSDYIQKLNPSFSSVYSASIWFKTSVNIDSSSTCATLLQLRDGGGSTNYFEVDFGSCTTALTNEVISIESPGGDRTGVLSITITGNVWHQLVINWNSGSSYYDIYLDGSLQTVTAGTYGDVPLLTDSDIILLGGGRYEASYSTYFSGTIDEVRISNIARTPEEIKLDAQKRPYGAYGVYTSSSIDLGTSVISLDSLQWSESITGPTAPSGWTKVKPVVIDNSQNSNTLTNYQVKLTVPYDSNMQTDFDDLRFYTSTGTSLDYWIESKGDGVEATVWIEVDSIPASSKKTIFMFYGNSGASAVSNGGNTFVFFEDFESYSIGNINNQGSWHVTGSGTNNLVASTTKGKSYRQQYVSNYGTAYKSIPSQSSAFIAEWNQLHAAANSGLQFGNGTTYDNFDGGGVNSYDVTGDLMYYNGTEIELLAYTLDKWYAIKAVINPVSQNLQLYVDGSDPLYDGDMEGNVTSFTKVFMPIWTADYDTYVDNIRIRQYTSSEPTVGLGADIEFQTRTSANNSTWEEWRPTGIGSTAIDSMDSISNWTLPSSSIWSGVPISTAPETTIKIEGTGSMKNTVGVPLIDANTQGLWHFDETAIGTGSTAYDSSTNNNHGAATGTTLAEGFYGKARSFNGTSNYISVKEASSLKPAQITLEAWVYPRTITVDDAIMGKTTSTSWNDGYAFDLYSNGSLHFWVNAYNNTSQTEATIPTGQWSYIVGTYDLHHTRLYVNGELISSAAYTAAITHSSHALEIGRLDGDDYNFDGLIDEARISSVALSDEQIAEAYRAGRDHRIERTLSSTDLSSKNKIPFYVASDRPGTYLETYTGETSNSVYGTDSNTKGLWHLDEKSGSGAYIKDSSGNANHGTPTDTFFTQGKIGGSRYFLWDGSTNYITVNDNSSLEFPSGNFSMEAWLKPDVDGGGTVLAKGTGSGPTNAEYIWHVNMQGFYFRGAWRTSVALTITDNIWTHMAIVFDDTDDSLKIYKDGQLADTLTSITGSYASTLTQPFYIGKQGSGATNLFSGTIDEVRVSNIARTADEIRLAYQYGLRTHQITIDYSTGIGSSAPTSTSDYDFNPTTTTGLYVGDTVIVREKRDSSTYIMQGEVTSISSGVVMVASWSGTAPSGGYTTSANVFKWQREYWDLNDISPGDRDTITKLGIRVLDASKGFDMYLDDFRSNQNYLTDPTGSSITSTPQRYFQYRAILSTNDTLVSPSLTSVTLDYNNSPSFPTLLLTEGQTNPTGVNDITPEFSAIYNDDANEIANYYQIQVDDDSGFGSVLWDSTKISLSPTCTAGNRCADISYGGSALTANTIYYWRIKFWDDGGAEGDWSAGTNTFSVNYPPLAPTSLLTEGQTNPTGITVVSPEFSAVYNESAYDSSDIANKYRIQVDDDSGFGSPIWDPGALGTAMSNCNQGNRCSDISYNGSDLIAGTQYYWRIKFWDDGEAEGDWSTEEAYFTINTAPNPPTSLLTEGQTNPTGVNDITPEFSAIYNDNPGSVADYYRIHVDDDPAFGSVLWDSTKTSLSPTCTADSRCIDISYGGNSIDLQWGKTYYWRIKFWDDGGTEGTWSTEEAYFTMTPIYEPTSCTIDDSGQSSQLIVKWSDNTSLETGYEIQRSVDGGTWTLLSTEAANTISKTDNSVSSNHTYLYRIQANSDNGNSQWCSTSQVDYSKGTYQMKGLQMKGLTIK